MADLNKIRGTSQIKPGTVPASAVNSAFRASGGDLFVDREDHGAEADGRMSFTLGFTPVPGSEHVFVRGTLRTNGYTLAANVLTFTDGDSAPQAGDDFVISYRKLTS